MHCGLFLNKQTRNRPLYILLSTHTHTHTGVPFPNYYVRDRSYARTPPPTRATYRPCLFFSLIFFSIIPSRYFTAAITRVLINSRLIVYSRVFASIHYDWCQAATAETRIGSDARGIHKCIADDRNKPLHVATVLVANVKHKRLDHWSV